MSKKVWTTTETGALCSPPPLRGQWGLLASPWDEGDGDGVPGSPRSRAECLAVHPESCPGALGRHPSGGTLAWVPQQKRRGLPWSCHPLVFLGPHTPLATNLFTQDWDLLPGGWRHVPSPWASESLRGQASGILRENHCWGPQLSSPPRMGAVFPSCDCISSSQGGSK